MIPQQENIVNCPACGQPMDVSQLPPYANAICPGCQALTRVKRAWGLIVLPENWEKAA